ncbi:MAG: hypothetical protein M3680_21445 [Myxococcota bacterium]|nr:hypothetical protein [Myxococcota bacterium]
MSREDVERQRGCLLDVVRAYVAGLADGALGADELLHEALLLRGFIVKRDRDGLGLARGSTRRDVEVLAAVLDVDPQLDGSTLLSYRPDDLAANVADAIVTLGAGAHVKFSPYPMGGRNWTHYRNQRWGRKADVIPPRKLTPLDLGISLLVKAFPLVRVGTVSSCDGHGHRGADVHFWRPWDIAWAHAVISRLAVPTPSSVWDWHHEGLDIYPTSGRYTPSSMLRMFLDIQNVARRWLSVPLVEAIGAARDRVLATYGPRRPELDELYVASLSELALVEVGEPTLAACDPGGVLMTRLTRPRRRP